MIRYRYQLQHPKSYVAAKFLAISKNIRYTRQNLSYISRKLFYWSVYCSTKEQTNQIHSDHTISFNQHLPNNVSNLFRQKIHTKIHHHLKTYHIHHQGVTPLP